MVIILSIQCFQVEIDACVFHERIEKMIEERRLYPITVLPSARRKSLETLFSNNFILAQDIADIDEDSFVKKSGIDHITASAIKREADKICPCTL